MQTVLAIVAVYFVVGLVLYILQDRLIFHPEKLPARFEFNFSIPFQEIFIPSSEGDLVNALLFTTENSAGVVFYFKGNTRSIKGWSKFAQDFLSKGFDCFMIDYPGFGKSLGKHTEKRISTDAEAAYAWLKARYLGEERVVVYGRSFGAGFAAKVASENQPRLLILDSPYYSFTKLASYYAFLFPVKWFLKYRIPLHKHMAWVKCPVWILHGTRDRVIPYSHSVQLEKEFAPRVKLWPIKNGRHNNLPMHPEYHEALDAILYSRV
jgi:alpha-beta hydrolase superfamily lysophospholipase